MPATGSSTQYPQIAPPPSSGWPCDNCTQHNPSDRKRCTDCGTSRH